MIGETKQKLNNCMGSNKSFNVQNMSCWYANFQKSPYRGPTPFPHLVASLPLALAPSWKSWLCQWSYCLCLLYISRYPSIKNIHFPWICIFLLNILFNNKNPPSLPKVCTRSFNVNLKNAKAPSHKSPITPSPRTGASCLACVFTRIL